MARFIEADVIQKIATEAEWLTQTRIPYKGQIMLVGDSSGKVTNIKVGDGVNPFADLNYMFDSIQQNVGYIAIESNALPTPLGDVAWGMVTEGTYTFGGSDVFTVPDGHWGIANYSSGAWSLVDMGELPQVEGTDILNPEGENIPKEKAVADYALERGSPRVLPEGWEVDVIDRPDLKNLSPTDIDTVNIPVVDVNGNLNHFIKTTSVPGNELEFYVVERPEYSMIVVDRDGNIIYSVPRGVGGGGGGNEVLINGIFRPDLKRVVLGKDDNIIELEKMVENEFGYDFLTYVNPTNKPLFDIQNPEYNWGINYDELIQKYDDLMDIANSNPESIIVSKGSYGTTGATGIQQYYYRLKTTDNPLTKIVLTSGTHAAEKMYIFGLYEIFKDLIIEPYQNPTIQWIRDNCEVVFIPCNCPESIGFPEKIGGSRTTPETRPFTASYSSDGTLVTITYTQSDFPTENTGLVWDDYFQVQPDKRMVTIWSTDDDTVLPRGVYEYTVLNGNTITILAPTSTVDNGTCEIQVWTDPNRNVDNGKGIYHNTVQSNSIQTLDDGTPYALYDHKGTKAGSVQEIRNFVEFLNDEKFDVSIDAHCPPRDHYMRGYIDNLFPDNIFLMQSIKSFASIFNASPFDENITNRGEVVYPGWVTAFNGLGVTIEWGSGMVSASSEQVTGAVRWAYAVLLGLLKFSVKRK